MIKFKFLLLYVLSALLFTNFLFSQTSLDDFDFSELDNLEAEDRIQWGNLQEKIIQDFLQAPYSFKKIVSLRSMSNIRDPRFLPIMTTFLDSCKNVEYKLYTLHAISVFSDTSNLFLPFPDGSTEFAIINDVKPLLYEMLNDSLYTIQSSVAHTLFVLDDSAIALGKIEELLQKGYYKTLQGFNIRKPYSETSQYQNELYDLRAKPFVENYLDHENDRIRGEAAFYFLKINEKEIAKQIADEILMNSDDSIAISIAQKIIYYYSK